MRMSPSNSCASKYRSWAIILSAISSLISPLRNIICSSSRREYRSIWLGPCGVCLDTKSMFEIAIVLSSFNFQILTSNRIQIEYCSEYKKIHRYKLCLLYTSDAADDLLCVDLGGRRIIKKKKKK